MNARLWGSCAPAFALAISLSACSGAPATPVTIGTRDDTAGKHKVISLPAGAQQLMYVSDDEPNRVRVYRAGQNDPPPLMTITAGISDPQSVAVDAAGTLYVTNRTTDSVTEYRAGAAVPFKTITNRIRDPSSVAIDKQGTLYVGNRNLAAQQGYVAEYAAGSATPTLTINFPKHDLPQIGGIAVDDRLNLYVEFQASGIPATVNAFSPGSTTGVNLHLKNLGLRADGVGIDGAENLYVATSFGTIAVFARGSTTPFRTIAKGLASPAFFCVDSRGGLFVPNQKTPSNSNVLEFAPGSNQPRFVVRGFEYPTGAAISPPM